MQNCYNWNVYPNVEFYPVFMTLINEYQLTVTQRIRLHAYFNSAINDATVITWYYKFLYDIPRPNQLDQNLETVLCTPYHPSYPSGHAVLGATAVELLSLLFPEERDQLDYLYSDLRKARFYSGVHFNADNENGEILGRDIGKYIFKKMQMERDENGNIIDCFNKPKTNPILKINKQKETGIFKCKSYIDKKSINCAKNEF